MTVYYQVTLNWKAGDSQNDMVISGPSKKACTDYIKARFTPDYGYETYPLKSFSLRQISEQQHDDMIDSGAIGWGC